MNRKEWFESLRSFWLYTSMYGVWTAFYEAPYAMLQYACTMAVGLFIVFPLIFVVASRIRARKRSR